MATNKTRSIPDKIDLEMMLLISQGGGQCYYLADIFECSKSAITQRMLKLQEWELVTVINTSQRTDQRAYKLTTKGAEVIQTISVMFQLQMLSIKRIVA